VPEGEEEPIIDALVMSDRQGNGQRMGSPCAAREELHAELRPGGHAHDQTVVEHRKPRRLEHDPSHLGMDVRAIGIPAPRAEDIADTQELHAPAPEDVDLA
jgi:hypothetical protein